MEGKPEDYTVSGQWAKAATQYIQSLELALEKANVRIAELEKKLLEAEEYGQWASNELRALAPREPAEISF